MKLLPKTHCRHCQNWRRPIRYSLCWTCYYNLEVRAIYRPTSKVTYRGSQRQIADTYSHARGDNAARSPAQEPTPHLPGSPGKVEVLTQRAANKENLWHPSDARVEE